MSAGVTLYAFIVRMPCAGGWGTWYAPVAAK